MSRNWTKSQLAAITGSGRDLLVSAGAGSGKTAVLTERIIRRLTDDANPGEITRMLIVTFTKAAAAELKERISAALTDALALDPSNKRLSRQLLQLDRAKICTIHSFCLDLLRANPTEAGLPADFRIADDAEIKLLRKSLMNELLEDYFSGAITDIEGFEDFADGFVGTKSDDGLADIFLDLDETFSSYRESIAFLTSFADELTEDADRDFAESRCGMEILELVRGQLTEPLALFRDILPELMSDAKLTKAYLPAFQADIDFIEDACRFCDARDYAGLSRHVSEYAPPRLGVIRNAVLSEDVEDAKTARSAFHESRRKLSARFFSLTPDQIRRNQLDTAAALRKLHTLLAAFRSRFTAEKRRRSLVDFNDLERLAAGLLIGADGLPTDIARTTAAQFDEICIDEYQDVNELQDAIFASISNGTNRFMVGDIKQSIYAFRGAQPAIFSRYRSEFGRTDDPELRPGQGATIFLSDNFRCDSPVIDFTNLVSACLFTHSTGDMPFYEEDKLVHSKLGKESGEPVRVVLIPKESDDEDESEHSCPDEASWVAAEIKRLLTEGKKDDGNPIKPSDIAILMRSAKGMAADFEEALTGADIPCYNNVEGDFFENAEVLLALCLLEIIDNPTRDIYLAGALKSPLFGFTLDELIAIRRVQADGCLYDALRTCASKSGELSDKCRSFLDKLDAYRRRAEGMPVDQLIWYLYTDTDLLSLVYGGSDGRVRRGNLMLLYEYARRFEGSSFKGLYNFIRYLTDILDEKAKLENAKVTDESSDTVKLMTIHQSKGLEFPVVFVCGCGNKFNDSDLRANVVVERSLGAALKLSDSTGFARYDTPVRQAIVRRLADRQLEEEMRILYVAMSRARERLYMTAAVSDPDELLEACRADAQRLSRRVILKNNGYMRWILTALAAHEGDACHTIEIAEPQSDVPSAIQTPDPEQDLPGQSLPVSTPDELVRERFAFVYPRAHASKLPAKLSVSQLNPTVLDEDDDSAHLPDPDTPAFSFDGKRPLFLSDTADEAASAAERGTATHLFMQFCDFARFAHPERTLSALVADEAARLGEQHYLTPRAASLVNRKALERFFASPLFAEICASPHVYREHRFNVKLPAAEFTADPSLAAELAGETVLVQGVIDCFFENADGSITLLDYKTDFIPRDLDRAAAEAMLLDRHRRQLEYYRTACEKIAAKKVARTLIWSFGLGDAVEL
ncbi:MAG: helicase-exonuclease AddAB subunit AddA [Clostridia bacterium]|nr:helicase-exonuclease AddAB subunit AddA [Clostridia bacterium]